MFIAGVPDPETDKKDSPTEEDNSKESNTKKKPGLTQDAIDNAGF